MSKRYELRSVEFKRGGLTVDLGKHSLDFFNHEGKDFVRSVECLKHYGDHDYESGTTVEDCYAKDPNVRLLIAALKTIREYYDLI